MTPPDAARVEESGLSLRVRAREWEEDAPPVDAFAPSRYGEHGTALAYRGRQGQREPGQLVLDELEGTSVRMNRARRGPLLRVGDDPLLPIFMSTAGCAIPQVGARVDSIVDWNLRHEELGHLALATLDAQGMPRVNRGLTLVAALLPLTLAPASAAAAPGLGGAMPVLAAPAKSGAEKQTKQTNKAKKATKREPAPAAEPEAEAGEGEGTAPAPNAAAVDPNTGPDARTEAPRVDAPGPQASGGGVWAALTGSDVRLTLVDGSVFSGRLLGVHGSVLVAAREGDGLVVAVDQRQVKQANVITRKDEGAKVLPRAPGTGLLIGGAIMTGVAGGLLLAGIGAGAYCAAAGGSYYYGGYYGGYSGGGDDSCWQYWVPMVVPAAALAGGGIPMIIIGKRRRDAWKKKVGVAQLAPKLTRTRRGWTGGITLRF